MVVFDSNVRQVLDDCMNDVENGRFNYRGWAVTKDILTINGRWKYVFVSHHPSIVELIRCSSDTENVFHDGEGIATFRIKYIPREMITEMVSRIIEGLPR